MSVFWVTRIARFFFPGAVAGLLAYSAFAVTGGRLAPQGNRANGRASPCVEQRKLPTPSSPRSEATENHRETVVRFARSALEAFSVVLGGFASRRTR